MAHKKMQEQCWFVTKDGCEEMTLGMAVTKMQAGVVGLVTNFIPDLYQQESLQEIVSFPVPIFRTIRTPFGLQEIGF